MRRTLFNPCEYTSPFKMWNCIDSEQNISSEDDIHRYYDIYNWIVEAIEDDDGIDVYFSEKLGSAIGRAELGTIVS